VEWRRVASPDGVGVIGSAIERPDRADGGRTIVYCLLPSHLYSLSSLLPTHGTDTKAALRWIHRALRRRPR
jgi:hypothetical protein